MSRKWVARSSKGRRVWGGGVLVPSSSLSASSGPGLRWPSVLRNRDTVRHSIRDAASALWAHREAGTPTRWNPSVPGAASGQGGDRRSPVHTALLHLGRRLRLSRRGSRRVSVRRAAAPAAAMVPGKQASIRGWPGGGRHPPPGGAFAWPSHRRDTGSTLWSEAFLSDKGVEDSYGRTVLSMLRTQRASCGLTSHRFQ